MKKNQLNESVMLSINSGLYCEKKYIARKKLIPLKPLRVEKKQHITPFVLCLLAFCSLITGSAHAFNLFHADGYLRWDQQDAISINIHQGDGSYLLSLPGNSTEWRATEAGDFFIVAATLGSWESWEKSQTAEVPIAVINSDFELRVSDSGSALEWMSPAYPHVINIHTGDGAYVTTVETDAQPWASNQAGEYFIVAATDSRWETWQKSNTVSVGSVGTGSDSIQLFSDGNALVWNTEGDYLSYNIHQGDGAYVTTVSGNTLRWEPEMPGQYYVVGTNMDNWTAWTRSHTFDFVGDQDNDPSSPSDPSDPDPSAPNNPVVPSDPSVLNVLNYETAISESLALLRGDFLRQVIMDLERAGYENQYSNINSLLGNPAQGTEIIRTLECDAGGQVEISGGLFGSASGALFVFDNCKHSNALFNGAVDLSNGFSGSGGGGGSSFTYRFEGFSQQNDDGSGLTLNGELNAGGFSIRGGFRRFGLSSNIVSYEKINADGTITAVFDSNYTQIYEIDRLELDDGSVVTNDDGSSVLYLTYSESGSGTFTIPTISGLVRLTIEPEIVYPQVHQDATNFDYLDVPSMGKVQMSVEDSEGNTVAELQVLPGAEDSGTVVYEINAGEITRIESEFFPAAECWSAIASDLSCFR